MEGRRELKLAGRGLGSGCVFRTSLDRGGMFIFQEQEIHVLFQWDYQVSTAPPQAW